MRTTPRVSAGTPKTIIIKKSIATLTKSPHPSDLYDIFEFISRYSTFVSRLTTRILPSKPILNPQSLLPCPLIWENNELSLYFRVSIPEGKEGGQLSNMLNFIEVQINNVASFLADQLRVDPKLSKLNFTISSIPVLRRPLSTVNRGLLSEELPFSFYTLEDIYGFNNCGISNRFIKVTKSLQNQPNADKYTSIDEVNATRITNQVYITLKNKYEYAPVWALLEYDESDELYLPISASITIPSDALNTNTEATFIIDALDAQIKLLTYCEPNNQVPIGGVL